MCNQATGEQLKVTGHRGSTQKDVHTSAAVNTRKTFTTKDMQPCNWDAREKDGLISLPVLCGMPTRRIRQEDGLAVIRQS